MQRCFQSIKCQYMTCFIQRTGIYQSLIMFVEVSHVTGDHWGARKKSWCFIRLEKVTKPSLKSLDSTNPQSDRLCTNGGNSRPLLPFQEAVAAAGLSTSGSSFSANIKIVHLFIRKFCLMFLFKKMFYPTVCMNEWMNKRSKKIY